MYSHSIRNQSCSSPPPPHHHLHDRVIVGVAAKRNTWPAPPHTWDKIRRVIYWCITCLGQLNQWCPSSKHSRYPPALMLAFLICTEPLISSGGSLLHGCWLQSRKPFTHVITTLAACIFMALSLPHLQVHPHFDGTFLFFKSCWLSSHPLNEIGPVGETGLVDVTQAGCRQ